MEDPRTHECHAADLDYVWQPVHSHELMAELGDRSMRHLTVHRTTICNACGRVWYMLEFDQLGADAEPDEYGAEITRSRRLVCAPRPQRLERVMEAQRARSKWKAKKKVSA